MSEPFGGSLPDEITLMRDEAAAVLLAIDDAIPVVKDAASRGRLEHAARIIVDKFLPDLPFL